MATKTCSTPGCENPAAFKTSKRPAFCYECIKGIFRAAGLELLEPFGKPDDYYLARCLTCGEELHYRFNYLLDSKGNPTDKRACRVCHWREWYDLASEYGSTSSCRVMSREEAESKAVKRNADLVKIIPGAIPGQELYITSCRGCGLLSVEREPTNHEKCRPLKAGAVKPIAPPIIAATPEKTYPITENQRASAREFKPDDHLAFLDDLSWWDFSRNDNKLLYSLKPSSGKAVFAFCSECGVSFEAPVKHLVSRYTGFHGRCPECKQRHDGELEAHRAAWQNRWEELKRTAVAENPYLLAHWDDDEDPFSVPIADYRLRKWICDEGHHPNQTPSSFLDNGCMVCSGLATKAQNAEEAKKHRFPDFVSYELRDQWHPTRNAKFEYGKTSISIKRKVWWLCDHCGYEWEESVRDRTRIHEYGAWDAWHKPSCRCPECGGVLGSLAWNYPSLAAEWSSSNPKSAWDVPPSSTTLDFVPQWVCSQGHAWSMPLASRINGATCPECQEAGKSKVELSYFKAAKKLWSHASVKSGVILRHENYSYPWTVDILVLATHPFIIEYDGEYWHADKADIDKRKSCELIQSGYSVVRLREGSLPFLAIDDSSYHEFRVLANGLDRDAVLAEISSVMGM